VASSPAVTVADFPINAGPDKTTASGVAVQLNGSTVATSYFWTPSFGVSDTTSLTPFVNPEETTTYTLTATWNGCILQDQVTVIVRDTLLIPTTFSPNGDGVNDRFEIKGIENYPNCFMTIYSRWGQEVFRTTGYSNAKAWDGRTKTGELNEGVYFYILELRDQANEKRQGSVTVIK
jgi:gliding motility-associated-like protein